MRTQSVCLALVIILMCPSASAQWVQTSLDSCHVTCLAADGPNLFAGTYALGVFLSKDNGSTWTTVNNGMTNLNVTALLVSDNNVFVGNGWCHVYRSSDDGTHWAETNGGWLVGGGLQGVAAFASSGKCLLAGIPGAGGGVFLSTDCGSTWAPVNSGLGLEKSVRSLAIFGTDFYAGLGGPVKDGPVVGVFRSSDSGTTWIDINSGLPNAYNRYGKAFAVVGSRLFAGIGDYGVFLTTNSGTNWTQVNAGLTDTSVTALAVSGTSVFVGTRAGIFLSTNSGASWTQVNAGLTDTSVFCLTASGTNLFAGTNNGVWRRPLSEMTTSVGPAASQTPLEYLLNQNYPNPFNPTTVISFQVPVLSYVKLAVFDLLGREVTVLVNERRNAGVHEVNFDATGLSSGVYVYRLRAGEYMAAKRMMLMR